MTGAVHPAHRDRGLGTELLAWVERASVPLHEERYPGRPLTVSGSTLSRLPRASELFAAHGYTPVRWFNEMVLDLAEFSPLPQTAAPAGVQVLPYSPERSEDGRLIRNEAFQDHWGMTESTPETWGMIVRGSSFRPELSWFAYTEDDEPLAVVLAEEQQAHFEATGKRDLYIALVATRRIGRKRGLASSLLTQVLELGREAGFGSASLGVDAGSLTGALALYERLGFHTEITWITQHKPLVPAPPA